jgi:hypothetical protein
MVPTSRRGAGRRCPRAAPQRCVHGDALSQIPVSGGWIGTTARREAPARSATMAYPPHSPDPRSTSARRGPGPAARVASFFSQDYAQYSPVSYPRCPQQARPCGACCATPPAPSRTGTPPGPGALQESGSQIFMTEGSRDILPIPACTHQKTPVPTAVPADIAETKLPGSGATLLYYTPAGSRAKGHPGLTPPFDIRAATACF